ncbi:MAG TPA: C-terminal binding protein [Capsulimonadaceae bacterium]|jgi:D-3-phosphoglycerate dehydrogenase
MKVLITDHGFPNVDRERAVIESAGHELTIAQVKTPDDVAAVAADADALLVQWATIDRSVIERLSKCKVIVRYGIGVDNVDLVAAKEHGIPVCNVPDYCIDEVADHSVALGLALGRQLRLIDRRLRGGVWKLTSEGPMLAFREMTFATLGFGRIARAVLDRARPFGFRLAACDPLVPDAAFEAAGVDRVTIDELFAQADILSLHAPLTDETHHLVNASRLRTMKPTSLIVNTARGPLIDTHALADALQSGGIAGAGIDVFDPEPLETDHPLLKCENAILTSHVAWCSATSIHVLQRKAGEEVVRGLHGEALANQVNR